MRLKPLCLAFALGLYSAGTAHAGLQDDMNSFFNNMSYASNSTSAKAWQGQAARYVTGGSFYARTGNKNIQLISISLPSINAGCGGIDVYLGSFSFINSDQIMAFVKQTMANAAGYFFDLALETTVPELKAAKDFLQKMAADLNRFNMSSCQAAKAMVDSVASLWGKVSRTSASLSPVRITCSRTGSPPVRAAHPAGNTKASRTRLPAQKKIRF